MSAWLPWIGTWIGIIIGGGLVLAGWLVIDRWRDR